MVNKKQYQEKYQVLEAHVCYRGLFAPELTKDLKKKKGFRAHHKFFKVEVSVDRSL